MKTFAKYIGLAAAIAMLPSVSSATDIDFESENGYKSIGVYDVWEESPFRTGVLQGNFAVTPNPDKSDNEATGEPGNSTDMVLGAQRSRFGSNRFGVRVDLNETFELTPTVKYVHVLIHKPKAGRVMLVGLGSRQERFGQNPYCEQFWTLSSNSIIENQWCDAVFAIKGAGGIDIRSLVVVPDCESPHDLAEDFLFYVDEIIINNSSTPRITTEYYTICGDKNTFALNREDRYSTNIQLKGSADGDQTISLGQQADKLVYQNRLNEQFTAKPGETVTPAISFNGSWMHAYCYLDRNNDGRFDATLQESGVPAEGSDVMSSSAYTNAAGNKVNSKGTRVNDQNFTMPSFTIPADLEPGLYRMRFKVDWDCIDPAGNAEGSNMINANGGVIADVMINIHNDNVTVNDHQLNGEVLAADGTKLNALSVPFGRDFTIMMNPEKGFVHDGVVINYGYNLDGKATDKYGNPQYQTVRVPASRFTDDTYTIPAAQMRGNVLINGQMLEDGTEIPDDDVYAINFPEDLTISRTDRSLNALTLNPSEGRLLTISCEDNTARRVYLDKLESELNAPAGATVIPTVNYSGSAMHTYFYVDLDDNGKFSNELNNDGTPAGELLSYSHYNGKNSTGATQVPGITPATSFPFVIPAETKPGVYRARFKIDWSNIDPAGQYSTEPGATNQINDNGGYVMDFMVHVYPESVAVTAVNDEQHGLLRTADGSVIGEGFTAPRSTELQLSVTTTEGTPVSKITLRRGYRMTGTAEFMGNTYWSETEIAATDDGKITIPADMMDRPIMITPAYDMSGICGMNTVVDETEAEIYELTGRRAAAEPTKGLYIVNGQKAVIR